MRSSLKDLDLENASSSCILDECEILLDFEIGPAPISSGFAFTDKSGSAMRQAFLPRRIAAFGPRSEQICGEARKWDNRSSLH
jgi:hypothetical protein